MHNVLRQILTRIQAAIFERPRRTIVASLALVLLAVVAGSRVEFRSSRGELVPEGDPDQRRWSALLEQYGGSEVLIACVEASDDGQRSAAELRAFVDRLAAEFRHDPSVQEVFHRFAVEWLLDRGLYLAPPEGLRRMADLLASQPELLRDLAGAGDLAAVNHAIAAMMERGANSGAAAPTETAGIERLVELTRAQRRFLEDPEPALRPLLSRHPALALADPGSRQAADGYLTTHDGSTYFLLITPSDETENLKARRELVRAARARAERVQRLRPGFHVAFTGQPALVVEEMDSVKRDTWRTSIVSILGVSLLTFLVFRWRSHALLVLGALGIGIAWAFGAIWIEYGYLNLITSSFISLLVGVGVAYGIHPVSEYEIEGAHRSADPVATVKESFHRTGAGVTVAAVTTAAAFFSIRLMQFRGFGELGMVAGVGVLLCLVAAMVTLPALLVVYARWRRGRDRANAERAAPAVDWFWANRASRIVCRHPRSVTAVAGLVTVAAGISALGIGFDTNILDLLPGDAESPRYQRRMAMESDLSPLYNIVLAEDMEGLDGLRLRAADEPTIERFESVARFLPADPAASEAALGELRAALDGFGFRPRASKLDPAELASALRRLEEALAVATESAFVAGLGQLAGPLEEARIEVETSMELVADADPGLVARWNDGQRRLWSWLRAGNAWIERALEVERPTLATLPPEIRRRFLTRDGAPLGFLYPAGSVFDPQFLDRYVAASRRVSPEVTGFPLVFDKMSRRISSGFNRSVLVGALLVTAILLIDYRRPRDVLLALVPLAMGVIWMMAGMRVLGLSFNFANLVAVPLIIGVGIDNGVHVIHRVRFEGRRGIGVVLQHTGRAILIASLTTMVGFGSLALASHRGLASLGLVLLLGVGSCLVTSTLVLPNLLVVLGIVDR